MISIEGKIVTSRGEFHQRVEIDEASGLIVRVGDITGSADYVFKDELIFPGFIDLHVHAREDTSHTHDYKEDFVTAGAAAVNGGVVAFADMPNNPIPPVDDASYEAKSKLAEKSSVPILLYAAVGAGTKPLSKKVPYKAFMGQSIGNMFFTSREGLENTLVNYQGQSISFHCEDPKILEQSKGAPTHEDRRPKEAEISAVELALVLTEKYNLTSKICHCSTMEGIKKIKEAKARGVKVAVETTPHHLYFSDTEKMLQVNPPIRQSEENRLSLLNALKNGEIDYLATDHAPHTIEEKEKGISGLTHLDTYGPFVTWLMRKHNFTPADIARISSSNPGNFFNQFTTEKYGEIREGYVGSMTVIDMNNPITITKEILNTKNHWSPFLGMTFPGSVVMTIIKGKIYAKQ